MVFMRSGVTVLLLFSHSGTAGQLLPKSRDQLREARYIRALCLVFPLYCQHAQYIRTGTPVFVGSRKARSNGCHCSFQPGFRSTKMSVQARTGWHFPDGPGRTRHNQ